MKFESFSTKSGNLYEKIYGNLLKKQPYDV